MIRKLVRQMLAAQVFSALTVSLCLLIDNVMISRFLGETGMAAYSLANPVLLAIGAIGSLLAAGAGFPGGNQRGVLLGGGPGRGHFHPVRSRGGGVPFPAGFGNGRRAAGGAV